MRSGVVSLGLVVALAAGCGEQMDPTPEGGAGVFAGAGGSGATGGGAGATGGGAGAAGGGVDPTCDGHLLPMAVGNGWTYEVTDVDGATSTKQTVVEDMQRVGGSGPKADVIAFHVITTKVSGGASDMTESWQDVLADGTVIRYRELSYPAGSATPDGEDFWEPGKLRVDNSAEHTVKGASWVEQYLETKSAGGTTNPAAQRQDEWTVEAVEVPCGPVAGTMLSCIRLSKIATAAAGGSKTYLFAPCVGKVREEGTQTEALTSFIVN